MSDPTTESAPHVSAEADAAAETLAAKLSPNAELGGVAQKIAALPPGVKLASNLDTYEKEKPQEPFWFQHGGQFFHLLDPDDIDFQDIVIGQENPRLMLHVILDPEQRDAFFAMRTSLGKMKKLIGDYTTHFGLTDLGELAGSARS